jgi:hypothetical protein
MRKIMKRRILIPITIICFAAGCGSRSEQKKLQGQWQLSGMSGEFAFDLHPAKEDWPYMTFTDNKFSYECREDSTGSTSRVTGTFSCGDTKISFYFNGRTVVGIYDFLSGGQLRIAIGEDEKVPPKTFQSGAAVLIFDRAENSPDAKH